MLHGFRVSNSRHLIVDGANILHAWQDLRRAAQRDVASARSDLIQRLLAIHDGGEVRVTVVFDGRGTQLTVEHPFKQATFAVVHTPSSMTADDVIEHLVANSSEPAQCDVATNDHAERQTVLALGAATLSSDDLKAWVDRAHTRQSASVRTLRETNKTAWKKP